MPTSQYATFEVAGQLFGVEVEAVQEVLSFSEYTAVPLASPRSEEHTSELQSPCNFVCRLLLEKKKSAFPRHQDNHLHAQLGNSERVPRALCKPTETGDLLGGAQNRSPSNQLGAMQPRKKARL